MSGVNYDGHEIRKGAADAVKSYVIENGGIYSAQCEEAVKRSSNRWYTIGCSSRL